MGFFNYLVNKLQGISNSIIPQRTYLYGGIYQTSYSNWKHDPRPLIWIQYSNQKYTHALNLHYMSYSDKQWFSRNLYLIKKAGQVTDGFMFYKFLKLNKMSIIEDCYRVYFTDKLSGRLVCAGVTGLDDRIYPSGDPYIVQLNKMLSKDNLQEAPVQLAYSQTELLERISNAQSAIPLTSKTVNLNNNGGAFGKAPWMK